MKRLIVFLLALSMSLPTFAQTQAELPQVRSKDGKVLTRALPIQLVDDDGNTSAVMTSPVPSSDPAAGLATGRGNNTSSGVISTDPKSIYGFLVTLSAGQGPGFLMVFDADVVPPDGPVTTFRCFYVDAGPRSSVYGTSGIPLAMMNGLSWAFSSAGNCQTLTRAPVNFVSVSYK